MRDETAEPEIIGLELIEFGEDRGYRRGRRRGLRQGREQGLQRALLATYAARFGEVPQRLRNAVEAMRDLDTLLAWQAHFATRSPRQIAALLFQRKAA